MSAFELIEADIWPALRQKIADERQATVEALIHCGSLDDLRARQGYIAALDWVLDTAKPKNLTGEGES